MDSTKQIATLKAGNEKLKETEQRLHEINEIAELTLAELSSNREKLTKIKEKTERIDTDLSEASATLYRMRNWWKSLF
jgi:hypothetical protein